MRISDWSSDVCSSDLFEDEGACQGVLLVRGKVDGDGAVPVPVQAVARGRVLDVVAGQIAMPPADTGDIVHAPLPVFVQYEGCRGACTMRSEEHTSELQSLMRISYAVFCLKKKKKYTKRIQTK